ncbi:ABC transporter permease [Allonocardiopsis opalescens]|uniref:ABC-2 type transport system permease protein n=1 Tax=Allonocardiopsis opalescens TaxID=1144618 RepID=A0A2T0QDB1_9ACTN|nr:ABC transporter permease subunit [Allonocardiopsis opalescens]PRY01909.1 ABC-2 type transport system permease protein [Allonocardiopsis opalescens]
MSADGTGRAPEAAVTAAGYRARRTLPLRVELLRQLLRRRTVITFGLLLALPWVLIAAFQIGGGDDEGTAVSLVDLATGGALNFTVFTMLVSSSFLLVVVVALFFGDTVASEANWSSLRYLLAAPVPRSRLLRQKLLVALVLSAAALAVLVVMTLVSGAVVYGWNPLTLPGGGAELPAGEGLGRVALIVGYAFVNLAVVAGAAFLLSVATDSPLGAVGGAVAMIIVSNILDAVEALGDWRQALPGHWGFAWLDALAPTVSYDQMTTGAVVSLSYAVVLFAWAFRRFRSADVVS